MDYRRIIKFGNSSHVVSVPKSWMEKNKLKKGDMLNVIENSSGELVFNANNNTEDKKSKLKKKSIIADGKDIEIVRREIFAAYINDFNIIEIKGENLKEDFIKIREILRNLVGLDVIEQTQDKLLLRDFLNLYDVSMDDLVRRIDILIRSMINDCRCGVTEDILLDVVRRDEDVNKLVFLGFRVIKRALLDPSLQKELGMDNVALSEAWKLLTAMEKVADELKRTTRLLTYLEFDGKICKKGCKKFDVVIGTFEKEYYDVMKAYYTNNLDLAYNVAYRKKGIMSDFDRYFEKNKTPLVGKIMERMKDAESHIGDIARVVYIGGPQ